MKRKHVGDPESYKGYRIQPAHVGPDLICYVNGSEIPNFFIDAESARAGGRRYVDDVVKAIEEQRRSKGMHA